MDYEEKKSMTKDICFQLRQITYELKEINIILKGLSQVLSKRKEIKHEKNTNNA